MKVKRMKVAITFEQGRLILDSCNVHCVLVQWSMEHFCSVTVLALSYNVSGENTSCLSKWEHSSLEIIQVLLQKTNLCPEPDQISEMVLAFCTVMEWVGYSWSILEWIRVWICLKHVLYRLLVWYWYWTTKLTSLVNWVRFKPTSSLQRWKA